MKAQRPDRFAQQGTQLRQIMGAAGRTGKILDNSRTGPGQFFGPDRYFKRITHPPIYNWKKVTRKSGVSVNKSMKSLPWPAKTKVWQGRANAPKKVNTG